MPLQDNDGKDTGHVTRNWLVAKRFLQIVSITDISENRATCPVNLLIKTGENGPPTSSSY